MSNYFDMLTQLNNIVRPTILGVDIDTDVSRILTSDMKIKFTPLSEIINEEALKETYEKGVRLWSYAIENNETLHGIQSVCFYTKKEAIQKLIECVRETDVLSSNSFYIVKDKYVKIDNSIKVVEDYREEIHFCSNCRLPLLSYEPYEKINDMYFHKSDCNTYESERRISWRTLW